MMLKLLFLISILCLFFLQLSSSYYVYQVSKKLKGAEEILQAMGYVKVGGSREAQELKYEGDVTSSKIAETAADLVILDAELQRISDLVVYSQSEHLQIYLSRILEVRSHPSEVYARAKYALNPNECDPQKTLALSEENRRQPYGNATPLQQQQQSRLPQTVQVQSQKDVPREPAKFHPMLQKVLGSTKDRDQQHSLPAPPQELQLQPVNRRGSAPVHQQIPPDPDYANHEMFLQQIESQCNIEQGSAPVPQQTPPNNQPYPDQILQGESYDDHAQGSSHQYVNTPKKNNRRYGEYEEIDPQPSTPFSPPDTRDFPDPIVQSKSELEQLNFMTEREEEISSIVNARSEGARYDDPFLYSLASTIGSPDPVLDKQAEDAWGVDPPSPQHTSPSTAVNEHNDLMQEQRTEPETTEYRSLQDRTPVDGNIVNHDKPSNEVDDNLAVTQDWLDENPSPGDYENQDNYGHSKDFKKYDKPVPETKQKMLPTSATEQLSNQPTLEPAPHDTGVDTNNTWRSNLVDFDNRQPGFKPSAKPRKKLGDVEKAITSPLLSHAPSETPTKHYTSPLTSLEQQERDNSLSSDSEEFFSSIKNRKPSSNLDTMPDENSVSLGSESNASEDYENVTINPATQECSSTTFKFNPSSPSPPTDSLSPMPRKRSGAMSDGSPTACPRIAVAPPSQECSSNEPSSEALAYSKEYLSSMLSNVESNRSRSNSHTNLDRGTRPSVNPTTGEYLTTHPSLDTRSSERIVPSAAVPGTWTCDYCTNIVFENNVCDVCGGHKPVGTVV